jgi:predicted nucleic acid-binding protein
MKNKAYDFRAYAFTVGEEIVVDTNIWLYMFPAPKNSLDPFSIQYSNGFYRMKKEGAQPVLDPLILSEYLNRYCRIEWSAQYRPLYPEFKSFRKSPDFKKTASSAAFFARRINRLCQSHKTSANNLDINQAIDDFESGALDFNDALLTDICKKNGFKLLTNDADFLSGGIEVLTTNPELLTACP